MNRTIIYLLKFFSIELRGKHSYVTGGAFDLKFVIVIVQTVFIQFRKYVFKVLSYYSGIQFYLLLSPYLCFIYLLNLDLYVLGDDALIS